MLNTRLIEEQLNEMASQKESLDSNVERLITDQSNNDYFQYAKLRALRIKQLAELIITELDMS